MNFLWPSMLWLLLLLWAQLFDMIGIRFFMFCSMCPSRRGNGSWNPLLLFRPGAGRASAGRSHPQVLRLPASRRAVLWDVILDCTGVSFMC